MSGYDDGPGSPWGRPGAHDDEHPRRDADGRPSEGEHDASPSSDRQDASPWGAPPPSTDDRPRDGAESSWSAPVDGQSSAPQPSWDSQSSSPQSPSWDSQSSAPQPSPSWDAPSSAPQQQSSWGDQADSPREQTSWGGQSSAPQQHQPSWGGQSSVPPPPWSGQSSAPEPSPSWDDAQRAHEQQSASHDASQSSFGDAPSFGASPSPSVAPHDTSTFPGDQPGATDPHQTTQFAPSRLGPESSRTPRREPWYRRKGLVIGGIIGVVVLLLAAIGIPLGIHLSNVAKGDRLAAEFNTELEAHNAAWTQDKIDTLSNVVVSDALQENRDFYAQNSASMADLQQRCENVATASTTLQELIASPVPTLADESGADASGAYQQAMQVSDGLADRRTAVDSLSTDGVAALAALGDFCGVFPEYNSILNAFGVAIINVYTPTLSIPNGGTIDFGNNLISTCNGSGGCPNYGDQAARVAYGDAIDTTFTTFYQDFAAKNAERCFLPEFAAVCDTYATDFQTVADAYHAAAESFRTEQINTTVGQSPLPTSLPLWQTANDAVATADNAVNAAWQGIDPETAGDTGDGWQARSVKRALAAHETTVTDAIALLG